MAPARIGGLRVVRLSALFWGCVFSVDFLVFCKALLLGCVCITWRLARVGCGQALRGWRSDPV